MTRPAAGSWPTRDLLTHRAAATPERPALIDADDGGTLTVRELDHRVDDMAARLAAAGVAEGDRVALLSETRPAFAVVVHAVSRIGGSVVPLDPRSTVEELAPLLDRAEADLLLCSGASAETAADLRQHVERLACLDDTAGLPPLPAGGTAPDPATWSRDDERVVMFTSGTTGRPKGVRLTAGNLRASAEASAYRLGVTPEDRWLDCLPMCHMGGLAPIVRTTLYGTTLVIQRTFDPAATIETIRSQDVTGLSLVPTMLRRLLDAGWDPPATLRTVLVGGAPTPPELIARCQRRDVPIYPTYGMTETASQIATARPQEAFASPETVGTPLVTTSVTIVDVDGQPVDPGERGEIVVDGPTVTPGYLDAATTEAAFGPHGLRTGDRGVRTEDGQLRVHGRVDNRIVTGGENVDPAEVAAVLRSHDAVADAAVVGVADEKWGQRVVALIVTQDGTSLDAADLDAHCAGKLAAYKHPKEYVFVDAIPRTRSGTVDREAARLQAQSDK